jgi:crossover junction endodeoxyribonuclease RusA
MNQIEITLPYPPSVNHYKTIGKIVRTKKGKIYQQRINSEDTKRFYYEVWCKIRSKNAIGAFSATISLEVTIDLHPPDKRRRDIDNGIKIILDSLQRGGLISDDNQICRLLVTRMSIIKHGQIIVRIKPYVSFPKTD